MSEPEDGDEPLDRSIELPIDLPITGTLDLHTFQPSDVRGLVPDYLAACRDAGIHEVRIIHGKGTGTLKHIVEKTLAACPLVASFRTADETAGGWGATLVSLRRAH
jgi:DNA-nicking Smr family endonuclease